MLSSRLTWGPSSGFLYSLFYSGLLIMYQYCYVCMKVRHTEEFGTCKGVFCTSSSIQIWNKTWMWAAVSDREQQSCHGPGFSFSSRLDLRGCFRVITNPQASNIAGNGVCPWFFVSWSNGTPPTTTSKGQGSRQEISVCWAADSTQAFRHIVKRKQRCPSLSPGTIPLCSLDGSASSHQPFSLRTELT